MTNTVDIEHPSVALIMSGGGARAAYQVGVLRAIARILPRGAPNPFRIICGTSAGAINAASLASNIDHFDLAVRRRPRGSMICRQSRDVTFVVHALVQDANHVNTVCRLAIKQNVRSGRIDAVASAHFGAFPA
jgi:hypothetical protein